MAYTNRGGPPWARSLTATTAGVVSGNGVASSAQAAGSPFEFPAPTSWLRIAATTNPLRVYFTQGDFDADTMEYLPVAAGAVVELPAELSKVWLRGVGGTAVVDLLGVSKV